MRCPQCGYVFGPLDRECPRCRGTGDAPQSEAASRSVDVDALVREALAGQPGAEELDAAIARVVRARYPQASGALTDALGRLLEAEMARQHCSRLEAAQRIAQGGVQGQLQVETTTSTSTYHSLEELPPELRERVERMMAGGKSVQRLPESRTRSTANVVRKQGEGEPVLPAGAAVAIVILALAGVAPFTRCRA